MMEFFREELEEREAMLQGTRYIHETYRKYNISKVYKNTIMQYLCCKYTFCCLLIQVSILLLVDIVSNKSWFSI
jgi:hypothetical protein